VKATPHAPARPYRDARPTAASGVDRAAPSTPGSAPGKSRSTFLRDWVPPLALFALFLAGWQLATVVLGVPAYLLPSPGAIVAAGVEHAGDLALALVSTFRAALIALALAVVIGTTVALLMSENKLIERSLYPYAIMLQTIPIVAIAPLIVIWFGAGEPAVVVIAFLISVFPIISNTTVGLTSTDHNLRNLMEMYNASWLQQLVKLRFPYALPYIMAGLRISSGLAVIGAIVGEFIAGIGGLRGGLGYVIVTAAGRLQMPYLFAAALTSSLLGIIIFIGVSLIVSRSLRHWHESSVAFEN
jgi:NitT/TauT family transport system permease protein